MTTQTEQNAAELREARAVRLIEARCVAASASLNR